jgi:ATP-dependent RNA helicase RhlE
VATDVAARGIDIPGVGYVYNYELPNVPENYIHRIGRTARAGASGQAIALCSPEEMDEFRSIEKLLGDRLPVAGGRAWQEPRGTAAPARQKGRPRHRGPRRAAARAA